MLETSLTATGAVFMYVKVKALLAVAGVTVPNEPVPVTAAQ